jgi:anti-sigma regulatory factor (Ser/Thr protein kinase)
VKGGVQATVRNWGQAFDPQSVPVPDRSAPLEMRPLGGLGLFLAGQLVDELEYESDGENGNTMTLVMHMPEG